MQKSKSINGLEFTVEPEWLDGVKIYSAYVSKVEKDSELLWIGTFNNKLDVHNFFESLPKPEK